MYTMIADQLVFTGLHQYLTKFQSRISGSRIRIKINHTIWSDYFRVGVCSDVTRKAAHINQV